MSESVPPNAAPTDEPLREEKPSSVEPERALPAAAEPATKEAPIWAQVLSIAVIVTVASWYLLSNRVQEREPPPESKARSVPAEDPDPQAQVPEPIEEAPPKVRAPASASSPEPELEQVAP